MHDPKCGELARYFLEDEVGYTEQQVTELADLIQQTIEDWMEKKA
jgi:hypothetical protein